ncbi:hypothetical protein C8J56DRAFT_932733 [Mycena floridula]|nr:hypothetical protein C8J56DRAFT_932733 [Mycena floridula]
MILLEKTPLNDPDSRATGSQPLPPSYGSLEAGGLDEYYQNWQKRRWTKKLRHRTKGAILLGLAIILISSLNTWLIVHFLLKGGFGTTSDRHHNNVPSGADLGNFLARESMPSVEVMGLHSARQCDLDCDDRHRRDVRLGRQIRSSYEKSSSYLDTGKNRGGRGGRRGGRRGSSRGRGARSGS